MHTQKTTLKKKYTTTWNVLSGNKTEEATQTLSNGMEKNKTKNMQFFIQFPLKSCENASMSAAILCPAVCISDVIACVARKNTEHSQTNYFLFFTGKGESTWYCSGELKFKAKKNRNKKQ